MGVRTECIDSGIRRETSRPPPFRVGSLRKDESGLLGSDPRSYEEIVVGMRLLHGIPVHLIERILEGIVVDEVLAALLGTVGRLRPPIGDIELGFVRDKIGRAHV